MVQACGAIRPPRGLSWPDRPTRPGFSAGVLRALPVLLPAKVYSHYGFFLTAQRSHGPLLLELRRIDAAPRRIDRDLKVCKLGSRVLGQASGYQKSHNPLSARGTSSTTCPGRTPQASGMRAFVLQ
jgi:hypothetical protein